MMSWRDKITIHPAAEIFPLLDKAELRGLADDIKANGLHEKIKIIERPRRQDAGTSNLGDFEQVVLDRRNRLDAMELAGLPIFSRGTTELDFDIFEAVPDETDPVSYVIGINIKRRHLTGEQKRDLIGKLLKLDPSKSNRQIAAIVGVDHKTVAPVRRQKEGRGEIPRVDKRVDTKGRQQPASKPKRSDGAIEIDNPPIVTTLAEMGKQPRTTKIALARVDGFVSVSMGLLFALEGAKPETVALIVQEMTDRQETRRDVKALRDWLNRLLAMAQTQSPSTVLSAPPSIATALSAEIPDIPACLDRRPKAEAIAATDKSKVEVV